MLFKQKFKALTSLLPTLASSLELMLKEGVDSIFVLKVEVAVVPLRLSKARLLRLDPLYQPNPDC